MELANKRYEKIAECFPKHRKATEISSLDVLNAVIYVLENGCKWRGFPKEYGNWHIIYTRMRRWAKSTVLQEAFFVFKGLGLS